MAADSLQHTLSTGNAAKVLPQRTLKYCIGIMVRQSKLSSAAGTHQRASAIVRWGPSNGWAQRSARLGWATCCRSHGHSVLGWVPQTRPVQQADSFLLGQRAAPTPHRYPHCPSHLPSLSAAAQPWVCPGLQRSRPVSDCSSKHRKIYSGLLRILPDTLDVL